MASSHPTISTSELSALTGDRRGPYCSYNPVSRTQIWQWCCAMGDNNPLYLDADYQRRHGIDGPVAPPAMMQMWTMRDVNMRYAPGSTTDAPYAVFDVLEGRGYPGNVAVSYDIRFHRLLREGDRAHHFNTIDSISELKQTALGSGFFVVEHAEFFDQDEQLYAEAFITYFQYAPAQAATPDNADAAHGAMTPPVTPGEPWQPDYRDLSSGDLTRGDALPAVAIPITHKLIVAGALAGQDFIDVHHNAPAARAAAMPDIFMNILTTCGLCARYLTDWAGPASRLRRLQLKLLAPNTPGDTMLLQGRVTEVLPGPEAPAVQVEFGGLNGRGHHVTGSAEMALAD